MNDLELYVKNYDKIKAYCRNIIKTHPNKEDFINDVVQEGYIKLYNWVNSPNYVDREKVNADTYIFPFIIKSVIYNKYKERNKEFLMDEDLKKSIEDSANYDQGIEVQMDKVLYEEVIQKMKSTDVIAFELHKAGYSDYEIRDKLDLTSDIHASVLAHRGKKKINKLRNR